MADETTETSTAPDMGTASNGQPQPPDTTDATQAQASPQQGVDPSRASLEKELQKLRSEQGRQMAELRRQAAQAQEYANQAEYRAQQAQMAGMDDFQKVQYRAELAERQVVELRQQVENQLLIQQRWEQLTEVSQETGVPLELLNQAATPKDMTKIVADYYKENSAKQVEEETKKAKERAKANKVDLGGGGPRTESDSSLEAQYKAARGDPEKLARLLIRK